MSGPSGREQLVVSPPLVGVDGGIRSGVGFDEGLQAGAITAPAHLNADAPPRRKSHPVCIPRRHAPVSYCQDRVGMGSFGILVIQEFRWFVCHKGTDEQRLGVLCLPRYQT